MPALARPDAADPPVFIELQTSQHEPRRMRRVGTLNFALGEAHRTRSRRSPHGRARRSNRLFVPFGDLTNGAETYKGGRYLELDRTPTGLYDLDFNRAYHPFCVYNPDYDCPVPPRENRLPVAIRAGERLAAVTPATLVDDLQAVLDGRPARTWRARRS